jgi:hypothetical protein
MNNTSYTGKRISSATIMFAFHPFVMSQIVLSEKVLPVNIFNLDIKFFLFYKEGLTSCLDFSMKRILAGG